MQTQYTDMYIYSSHHDYYSLHGNQITSKGASALFDTLTAYDCALTSINLQANPIDDTFIVAFGKFLQSCETVECLNLSWMNLKGKSVQELCECLIGNTTLKELHLSGNSGITDASTVSLKDLANNTYVTNLYLEFTSMSYVNQLEIEKYLKIPFEERKIPIKSKSKSAAKTT